MNKKKILVTGYPHTGTSILKSKIGECNDVYEYPFEYYEFLPSHIVDSGDKKFLVMKTPVLPVEFRIDGPIGVATNPKNKYHDYYTILLIRNPWYVFTSIIKKGFDPLIQLDNSHWQKIEYFVTIGEYIASAKKFLEARKENYPRIFTLKYEEFFDLPVAQEKSDPSWFAFPLTIKKTAPFTRADIVTHFENNLIQTRPYFAGNIMLQPAYNHLIDPNFAKNNFPVATHVMTHTYFHGTSPVITPEQISYIGDRVDGFMSLFV